MLLGRRQVPGVDQRDRVVVMLFRRVQDHAGGFQALLAHAGVQSGAVGHGAIRPAHGRQKEFPGLLELARVKQTHALLEGLHLAWSRRSCAAAGVVFAPGGHPRRLTVLAFLGRRSFWDVALFGTLRHRYLLLHGHNGAHKPATKSVSSYTRPAALMQGVAPLAQYARAPAPSPVWRLSHTAHPALYSVSMKRVGIFFISVCAFAAAPTTEIKVDQVGYLPDAPKLAMVVSHTLAKEFSVRRAGNDSVAFHGKLRGARH